MSAVAPSAVAEVTIQPVLSVAVALSSVLVTGATVTKDSATSPVDLGVPGSLTLYFADADALAAAAASLASAADSLRAAIVQATAPAPKPATP